MAEESGMSTKKKIIYGVSIAVGVVLLVIIIGWFTGYISFGTLDGSGSSSAAPSESKGSELHSSHLASDASTLD